MLLPGYFVQQDPPFVVTGQVIENGEIINASGFAIDILNELAMHFNFR